MCAMDLEGRIIYWNAGAVHSFGYSEAEAIGHDLAFLFTPEDVQAGLPKLELRVAAERGRSEDERWHVRKDGSRFWALGLVVPVRDRDGVVVGFGKILRDRTDLKELHDTLRNRASALARADEDKNIFLATLAHELRNPLAALLNGATLLRKAGPSRERIEQVTALMERQALHAKRLIDDLLDIVRIGRSKLQLQRVPIDLRDVLQQALDTATRGSKHGEHDFRCDLPKTALTISGEPHRLLQIFVNLLNNAVKFTQSGGRITLSASAEGPEAVVRVVDTGVGIPPDKLASIFDLFSQAHAALPGSQAGLGIGLALSRDLVALHEGTLQVRSEGSGAGSEFIVRLPLIAGRQSLRP